MRAGRLDRLVTLQRFTTTHSPSGQPIQQWTDLSHRRPARRHDMRGSERFTADQFAAHEQVAFDIRWSSALADLNPLDRLIYPPPASANAQEPPAHTVHDIMAVEEIGRREGLLIRVRRRAEVT